MEKIKVNIREFQEKYTAGALIPVDIAAYFTECFLRGENEADIRATVYEEMNIKKFYNEHPELEPKIDWQTFILSRHVIDLLKRYINKDNIEPLELNDEIKRMAIILDSRKVKNEPNLPTDEIQSLYNDLLWLKCDILKQ